MSKPNTVHSVWRRIQVDTNTGCWLWMGSKNSQGYGHIGVKGKIEGTHRVAFKSVYGYLTKGLDICHHCDNPPCVNPEHLFEGTRLDNIQDAMHKGRIQKGEQRPGSKLTEEKVRQIRCIGDNISSRKLAKKFGVSYHVVATVLNGTSWKHVL